MGRRKNKPEGQADMPPATADETGVDTPETRKGSRHKPRKMMPLPPWLYDKLKVDARRNGRPATWHLRHIVTQALIAAGVLTQEEVDQHAEEDEAAKSEDS